MTNTHINGRSLSWIGTDTSLNCGGVKQALLAQIFPLIETMWSGVFSTCEYDTYPHIKLDEQKCCKERLRCSLELYTYHI